MRKIIAGRFVEWDDIKALMNKRKHGVSFDTASLVFADKNRIEVPDEIHSIHEERYKTLGKVGDVLFVVYTEREEAARIITARKATPRERKIYYDCAQIYL